MSYRRSDDGFISVTIRSIKLSYEILHCEHVDDDTGEYTETELWEIRDVDTGDVDDCCLDDEQIIPYENDAVDCPHFPTCN